jgi:hypothetical protein
LPLASEVSDAAACGVPRKVAEGAYRENTTGLVKARDDGRTSIDDFEANPETQSLYGLSEEEFTFLALACRRFIGASEAHARQMGTEITFAAREPFPELIASFSGASANQFS